MVQMNKVQDIYDYLDELYEEPKCELLFEHDYELLIAVMLSAQCTDKRVNMVTRELFKKYKNIYELNEAKVSDISNIIRPVGTFNKKSKFIKEICSSLIENYSGIVPNNRKYLESLPGVGRKTTNVVLGILYNEPSIAVDTHVARVSKRLGLVKASDDVDDIERKLMKKIDKDRWLRFHYQMVLFGRYKCKAKSPICDECKLKKHCKNSL